MLVDDVEINVKGGKGGDGIVHFRREKFVPKGGPDGGNGGKGGDVKIVAVRNINALYKYKTKKEHFAEDGSNGEDRKKHGGNGDDLVLKVPVGTVITNRDTNEVFDITNEGDEIVIASGGIGGMGNTFFKSSVNTTPKKSTKGQDGQSYNIHFELKLFADLGFIGFPNAGKSTLLNSLTGASAKTGDYAFTTKEPNIGVCHGYVFIDIPGLIEGASLGKGLGLKFLRHIKRAKGIAHLISLEEEDVKDAYLKIRKELEDYSIELSKKKEIIILTKKDMVSKDICDKSVELMKQFKKDIVVISVLDDNLLNKGMYSLISFAKDI